LGQSLGSSQPNAGVFPLNLRSEISYRPIISKIKQPIKNSLTSTVVTIKFAALWLLLAAVLLLPSLATASTLTWDPGKSTIGSDSGGSTTWTSAVMANWATGGVDGNWVSGADASIGAGGTACRH